MTRSDLQDLHGLLVVDKPVGLTSHDVVSRVRRMAGMKRVGHGGTLDPFATGVLVVALGRATKVLQYIQNSDKRYLAEVTLGVTTDTLDVEGVVSDRRTVQSWPTPEAVSEVLTTFIGDTEQVPPAYSAIKVGGRKLYEMARAGQAVEVPTRTITIHSLDIIEYDPPTLVIDVVCGKGTYIRSLARDIGVALGTLAYCRALRRTVNGPFAVCEAWTMDALADRDLRAEWPQIGLHPDAALEGVRSVVVNEAAADAWYHGRPVAFPDAHDLASAESVCVYDASGLFLGIGVCASAGTVKPTLVFPRLDVVNGGWPER
jgi:tRNA pseudouridine55 synthase